MMWPPEYEELREEARAVGNASVELHTATMAGLDEDGRVAKGRELLALLDQDAPGGRDETIAGISCRVLGWTKGGQPVHPLHQRADAPLLPAAAPGMAVA